MTVAVVFLRVVPSFEDNIFRLGDPYVFRNPTGSIPTFELLGVAGFRIDVAQGTELPKVLKTTESSSFVRS